MRFSWLLVSLYCLKTLLVSGYVYDADYLIPRECDLCLASTCPQLTYCIGEVVKDHCGCCQICSSDLFPKKSAKQLPETPIEALPATVTPEVEQNKSGNYNFYRFNCHFYILSFTDTLIFLLEPSLRDTNIHDRSINKAVNLNLRLKTNTITFKITIR